MAKQIKTNEAIRVILTYKENGRASGGGFIARLSTCCATCCRQSQTVLERAGTDELEVGTIEYQIWDAVGQDALLPPGALNNGKHGGSSRLG